jgi:hypothetical protein
LIIRYNNHG